MNFSDKDELVHIIKNRNEFREEFKTEADRLRRLYYKNKVFIRGLIEVSSFCRCGCFYCGLRAQNDKALRYRLTDDEILECCAEGYNTGFRTFVLQGGEDLQFSEERVARLVGRIKSLYPDCAVTLSLGERPYGTYKAWKDAGADRYLLRHETADPEHYSLLHPSTESCENRKNCLYELKELGFQTGAGFMVGSPFQTEENLADDILFLQKLKPEMIGIGPFIPHHQTPFADRERGSVELTLFMLSLLRLVFPSVLLPSTTALSSVSLTGREDGILCGANVIMPNLSPVSVRKKYAIYDNKKISDCEAAENLRDLRQKISGIGFEIVTDIGNYRNTTD